MAAAQNLAREGEDVTLVWVPDTNVPADKTEQLKTHLHSRHSLKLEILLRSEHLLDMLSSAETRSLGVYYYLKNKPYKTVYFALERGLAYYPLLARETSLAASNQRLIVLAHSPFDWLSEADRFFLKNTQQVSMAAMERYCVEAADRLICVSSNLLKWFKSKEWRLPKSCDVLPALLPYEWSPATSFLDRRLPVRIREIVLLAGSNFSDGITLFCDALDVLARLNHAGVKVTAFGPFGKILGEHTGGMFLRRARRWPFELQLFPRSTFNDCLRYVSERDALAVIPNYDNAAGHWVSGCLRLGIPFVATSVGGNTDQVPHKFRKHCLTEPDARELAAAISARIENPVAPVARQSEEEKCQLWLALHRKKTSSPAKRQRNRKAPLVSIVLVHHDRPQYLLQAVRSIEDQDYRNLEVVLVDDGSRLPESRSVLDRLEDRFKKRRWKIVRSPNRYVGAARNAGVKAASGQMIIFLDDDNALFRHAVGTFVRAIEASGADICTAFQKILYDSHVPGTERTGFIQYHCLGGSLDLGLISNTFGDTGAIYRRSVFKKIGFQLEKPGNHMEDWEFFARAALAGLKIRMIPEALYWYRSSTRGRYRTSHWYDNRLPILAAYRKHKFKGLEHAFHLLMAQNVSQAETEGYRTNLRFSPSDASFLELSGEDPNSQKALGLLARIAAAEGRPTTALTLLGGTSPPEFDKETRKLLGTESSREVASRVSTLFTRERTFTHRELMNLESCTTAIVRGTPLSYVESPDRFFLLAEAGAVSLAALPAGCPVDTVAASAQVSLDQAETGSAEFMILLCAMHEDPVIRVQTASAEPTDGSSGWIMLNKPFERRAIEARLSIPTTSPVNLVVAVRTAESAVKRILGCFSRVAVLTALTDRAARRPRVGPPSRSLRAREWSDTQRKSVRLISDYRSELPLLLFPPQGQGIFLRPHESGPVVAVINNAFPPFARRLIGKVEIAHEEAAPFEFAMALSLPTEVLEWRRAGPKHSMAFSGWTVVQERFKLHDVEVELPELVNSPLTVSIAVRLPKGSAPTPSNAFWRKLVFMWDE